MTTTPKTIITISTSVNSPINKVWDCWTMSRHVTSWNAASPEWHTPYGYSDLRVGGMFTFRMEARDGSMGFDFGGIYDKVILHKHIEYTLGDGRKVNVTFEDMGNSILVTESFEAEGVNSLELQQGGWQAILNSFKSYVEKDIVPEILHFEIKIAAAALAVQKAMLDDKGYREWTAAFNSSSHFRGSWAKGSKILFIGTDQNGDEGGMVSFIKENIPGKFLSIQHNGVYKNGDEIVSGPEVETWAGSLENYTFTEVNGQTIVSVDMDSNEEFKAYFSETWPKALLKLKQVCER
jgi:uncharacterized protein YndB with AHSA1/START domain